jgi:protein-disulfide isomerase
MTHSIVRGLAAAAMLVAAACHGSSNRVAAPSGAASAPAPSGLEDRVAKLEAEHAKNAEALEFLNKVYAQQKAQAEAAEREEPAEDAMFALAIAADVKGGQVEGPATASVTIVKAFDFACPYCQRMSSVLSELVKEYDGKVRVVYTNLLIHAPARPAHLAGCAAGKQGKYKEFKDAFWDKGFLAYAQSRDESKLGEDNIFVIAKGAGLNVAKLKADMKSPECEQRLTDDASELEKFHVTSTPTFFINGRIVSGALPKPAFKQLIDEELKKVEASGVPGAEYYDKVVLAKGERAFRSKADPKPAAR